MKYLPLLCAVALLFILAGAPADAAGPRLEVVGGESIDLGRGRPGRFVREIAIANTGDDTLRLLALNSGCGCLLGEPDRTVIAPGDTALVVVTAETSGQVVEEWRRTLSIASNDPRRPVVDVVVRVAFAHDLRMHTLINTVRTEPCADGCTWTIELENIARVPIVIDPPFVEEMRGATVTFDLTAPRTVAPGERLTITGRIAILGGEEIPMIRAVIPSSGQYDPRTPVAWFLSVR